MHWAWKPLNRLRDAACTGVKTNHQPFPFLHPSLSTSWSLPPLTGSLFSGLFSSSFRGVSSSAPNLRELARTQRKKAMSPQSRISREGMSSVQLCFLPLLKQADEKNTHSSFSIFLIHFYCAWQSMFPNYFCATLFLKTRLSHIQTFVYAQTWLKAAQIFGFLSIPSFFLKPAQNIWLPCTFSLGFLNVKILLPNQPSVSSS